MALTFGAGTADRVSHGSAASLDNLPSSTDGMTVLQWVYVTTRTDTRKLSSKGRGTAGVGWQLGLSGIWAALAAGLALVALCLLVWVRRTARQPLGDLALSAAR